MRWTIKHFDVTVPWKGEDLGKAAEENKALCVSGEKAVIYREL